MNVCTGLSGAFAAVSVVAASLVLALPADVTYVAHQGEEWLAPNHSKAAYQLAVDHGLEIIKLDLHPTKDGHIVINHDNDMKHMLGWEEKIHDHTLAEIKSRFMGPRGGYTNQTACTLEEALEYGKQTRLGIWLDFKEFSPKMFEQAIALCDKAGLPHEKIMVATFNTTAILYCRDHYPEIKRVHHAFVKRPTDGGRGFLTNLGPKDKVYANEDELIAALLRVKEEYGLYGFNMPHIIRKGRSLYHTTEKVLRGLKKGGAWISIWFVEDEVTGELYRKWGADNFVTSCKARTLPGYRAAHPKSRRDAGSIGPGWFPEDVYASSLPGDVLVRECSQISIEEAIDAAAKAGGGRVFVPAGEYEIGTIELKSNVELHLARGVCLKASKRGKLFKKVPKLEGPDDLGNSMADALLRAIDCENVAITGEGTVDGDGRDFFDYTRPPDKWGFFYHRRSNGRPWSTMLAMYRCRNVKVTGVTFKDAASWTFHLRRCENVLVDGAKLINDERWINSDGLDLDGGRNIRIVNTEIVSGDDGIVLRASPRGDVQQDIVLEDVLVENCVITSGCQVVRVGCPSDDTVRNIAIRNVKGHGMNGVFFDFPSHYVFHHAPGHFCAVENVTIDGFSGDFRHCALKAVVEPGVKIRGVKNCTFRNFDVVSRDPIQFTGNVWSKIEGMRGENVIWNGKRLTDGEFACDCANDKPLLEKYNKK